MPFETSLDQIS